MTRRKKPAIEVVNANDEFGDPHQIERLLEQQYRIAKLLEQDLAAARARQKEAN